MPGTVDGVDWSSYTISLTLRPSSPPLLLTSSSQIFQASKPLLPFGPRPPVIAMLEPILISPDWALAPPVSAIVAAARTAAPASNCLSLIQFPPIEALICRQFTIFRCGGARG